MNHTKNNYTLLDHTADIGIEVYGKDFSSLLENTAKALFSIITDISKVRPKSQSRIELHQNKEEEMMRSWLEQLLYQFNTSDMLFSQFKINISNRDHLTAQIWGEIFNDQHHLIHTEIKGITYHNFEVSESENGWFARIIFDV